MKEGKLQMNTPVVFLIFNRPDTTRKVFERIRQAKPKKLYVIADGPRPHVKDDVIACKQTRAIVEQVDWDCEVFHNYAEENMGLKRRVYSGLDWVFEQEEEAIILEDDCLPDLSFFPFCEELLEKYRNDSRIRMISGTNFLIEWKSDVQSYHFSDRMDIWGWATWRRAWKDYDPEMSFFKDQKTRLEMIRNLSDTEDEVRYSLQVLELISHNKIDSWAYAWHFANLMQHGLSIVPSVNLVTNIGFGSHSTHTKSTLSPKANLPTRSMTFPLNHPRYVFRDKEYKFGCLQKISDLRIIIFGAGDTGLSAYWYLKNKRTTLMFCDNDPTKWGTKIEGIEVIPPSELPRHSFSYVLIASARHKEIASQLREMGIDNYRIFDVSFTTDLQER